MDKKIAGLLGAVAAPDIGTLFSPSDPRWKGADSALFLAEALKPDRFLGERVADRRAEHVGALRFGERR